MLSCAWLWVYAGAILMFLELISPGFVIFFFGLSAATVGLCRFVLGDLFTATWQMAAFSAFSVLYLVFLRRWMTNLFSGKSERATVDFNNESVGRLGTITEAIKPPLTGRVMIGDAEWTAAADVPIAVGTNVKVIEQTNLTMKVEAV
jgi:inner membrane protein